MKVYSVLTAWAMIKIDGEYMIEYDPAKTINGLKNLRDLFLQ